MPPHDATPPPPKTRTPRQDRSRTKVDLIVEAAIRILEGEGLAALTTNRIADVAGVSIGTLYQYFRSKEAVVEFLVARELAVVRETAEAMLQQPEAHSGDPVRPFVRTLLNAFGSRHRARKLIMQAGFAQHTPGGLEFTLKAIQDLLSGATGGLSNDTPLLSPVQAMVLSAAVNGAISRAVQHDERLLSSEAFEDALVRLITGFFVDAHGSHAALKK